MKKNVYILNYEDFSKKDSPRVRVRVFKRFLPAFLMLLWRQVFCGSKKPFIKVDTVDFIRYRYFVTYLVKTGSTVVEQTDSYDSYAFALLNYKIKQKQKGVAGVTMTREKI